MHKRISLAFFIVMVSAFAVAYLGRRYIYRGEQKNNVSTVIVPDARNQRASSSDESLMMSDESAAVSLVPLKTTETLISIVSQDFDGDGYDDQICAIKTLSSPYLSLLVGMYNPETNEYQRSTIIDTQISQVQTFSFMGIDLTGDHRTALVFQGFAENGDSVLQAYFIKRKPSFSLKRIADFRGDGTVFIQQMERYDSYERTSAHGVSFPIWVYSTDSETASQDQLQVKYNWNEKEEKYTQTQVVRVAGNRIAAKELSRIQDGTVKTFAGFLNGLWYKTDNNSSNPRYLFFDYDNSEVIFFQNDLEEVYKWVRSNLRRNGIYLSAVNQEIENLQRRIDISLRNVDEIQLRLQDDVRMIISESTLWDGRYKKMSGNAAMYMKNNEVKLDSVVSAIESESMWATSDAASTIFTFRSGNYTVSSENVSDSGIFTEIVAKDGNFLQFRSFGQNGWFQSLYRVSFETDSKSGARNIVLEPYKALSTGFIPLDRRPLTLVPVRENPE